jgi:hypothetical protein
MKNVKFLLWLLAIVMVSSSCQKSGFLTRYGIFHVKDDATATMNGVIGGRTDNHYNNMVKNHPDIQQIVLENCPGSKNDEVNLIVAKKIHDDGISTHLRANSEIASGAVDLYLAGVNRTMETGAKIGVHSWSGGGTAPTDLPESDPQHLPYINYYISVGMSEQLARDFYFFTIHAAPASDVHWMTPEEIVLYQLLTF